MIPPKLRYSIRGQGYNVRFTPDGFARLCWLANRAGGNHTAMSVPAFLARAIANEQLAVMRGEIERGKTVPQNIVESVHGANSLCPLVLRL
jgi:hypothetical protein